MKNLMKCFTWFIAFYGADTWTFQKIDRKYLGSFEIWCWDGYKINWTNRVKNEGI